MVQEQDIEQIERQVVALGHQWPTVGSALGVAETPTPGREGTDGCQGDWHWYQSVYEAVAAAVRARRKGLGVLVCVMVDYLGSAEMGVFEALSRLDGVHSVAFAAAGGQGKLSGVRGANQAVGLDSLGQAVEAGLRKLSESFVGGVEDGVPATSAESAEPAARRPVRRADEAADQEAAQGISDTNGLEAGVAREETAKRRDSLYDEADRDGEPKAPPQSGGEVHLTEEELDALLG